MPYVMVPVPEEHVQSVMQLILRMSAQAALSDWDHDSVVGFYGDLDEDSRSVLSFVARGVVTGEELAVGDVATMVELNARETSGIVREINDLAADREHPVLIKHRLVTEVLPNGRTQEKQVLSIEPELAVVVQDVARADLLSEPDPFADS